MLKRSLIFAVALSLISTVAAAQTSELRIGLASDPDALDPTTSGTLAARQIFTSLCDRLVFLDADLKYQPQLAKSWAFSDDMKELVFKLRENATFHDGEPVDAAAVVYNMNRHLTLPGSNRRSEISEVTSVEAVDRYTVKFRMARPFVPVLAALADRASIMISPKAAEQAGNAFAQNPVCSGPYKFVERVPQHRIVLQKYENYWDAQSYPVKKVTYYTIVDPTVRLANLRSGQLDVVEGVSPTDVKLFSSDKKLKLYTTPSLAFYYIIINIAGGDQGQSKNLLSQDKRIREALELSIDREIINKVAFEGMFMVSNQPEVPGSRFHIKEIPTSKRDVKRARELVKEATGGAGVTFSMLVPNVSSYQRMAEIIQGMAAEAGITVKIITQETTTLLTNWAIGNFEAVLNRWSGRADPDGNVFSFKTCGGSRNGGKYCNAVVDANLEKARTSTDDVQRYSYYKAAAEQYLADRPYIYLFHGIQLTGTRASVKGLSVTPDGVFNLKNASVE
jgi:peptide/nickel transport system substrate-binding protein